jgi:hypothetical protein
LYGLLAGAMIAAVVAAILAFQTFGNVNVVISGMGL